ncbi:CRISPR-associated helicase Cas3' [Methanobrevibacter smithii]|uniref:CRISPR-associated helicase Cas3' n=1 Tax=Methanobrevibacter smithii TaxID=2173 RepID=UPI001FCBA607|nr:CRISPR-associated helicase Cas3' [Methanobrevibacter smithii]MBS6826680.1 CRISPR-associated helicase Cas3' [Methanobrevibacter smithii]BDF79789.1 CRISPR-associated helicase/endonuclease Cas3 [Methanobrevibacter smithii]BDF81901.1 CRISPR-associated helicase/endonuclease Cas3 [Methanobrevibacter smithii]
MPYTDLMSHPNKKLENHLKNVADFSYDVFNFLEIENKELFSNISFLIGLTHDFAKSTSFFQTYLSDHTKKENTQHSFLSAIFTYYVVKNYLDKNNINFESNLSIISYIVVLAHHGNLKDITKLDDYNEKKINSKMVLKQIEDLKSSDDNLSKFYDDFEIDFFRFFDEFDEISEEITDGLLIFSFEGNIDNYFYILLFYSSLLDADKMDASESKRINRENIPGDIVDIFKKNNLRDSKDNINKTREEAYQEVNGNILNMDLNERILSIELPTGIGKTFTGVSAALKLKERINNELNFNPRIIYSLPFLTIVDQNSDTISSILNESSLNGSNFLLNHNHLSDMNYKSNDLENYDISNSKILIEGWNSEIIVTTFIQFFYSIISNKNKSLRKFHNITNSIILLDEIQSLPYKYWKIINLFFKKLAYEYNCWIILMTATQPYIFKENEIKSLVDNVDYYFNKFDRVNYNFNLDSQNFEDFKKEFVDKISNDSKNDYLVVLNTINSSKELYEFIKDYYSVMDYDIYLDDCNGICYIGDDIQLIYLSNNIIPKHRLEKINAIKESNRQSIVISTQLIEAGVDIDVDIIYRDLAPLDSLVQTAGRCNRSGNKEKGIVNVISLKNENGKSYSSFIYDSLLLNKTKEVLTSLNQISEKEFNLAAAKNYFKLIYNSGTQDDYLIKIIENLRFPEIPSNFKLIEEDIQKVDVFVVINSEAKLLFEKYNDIINNYKGFDRKNEFLKIKNKFYKYVISVDETKIGSANNLCNDEIFYIGENDVFRKYDLDTGFKPEDDENPFII